MRKSGYATHYAAAKKLTGMGFMQTTYCVPAYWIGPNNARASIYYDSDGRYHIR